MLLILVPLGVLDLFLKIIGVKINFLDPFINKFYPDLWGQED